MSAVQQLGSAAAARVGELLARTCFAERVEAARTGGFATYEPWPPIDDPSPTRNPSTASGGLGEDLWRLAHLGVLERGRFDQALWADLCAVGLAKEAPSAEEPLTNELSTEGPSRNELSTEGPSRNELSTEGPSRNELSTEEPSADERARPGRFELTAHRSLIAARDRPRGSVRGGVHIGEDSLRFAEAILGVAPRGVALDVGCGSGISTCALGRTCEAVHAIDVVDVCLDATALSMGLNGMGAKASVSLAQLDAYEAPQRFDCAIGNLPGVPVPPGLNYPPDGAGGPDGLELMRLFLERCESSLLAERGIAIMRFQSLGDERGPLLLGELGELARRARWDISVLTESRIPASVRAALTAHHALPVNPGIDPLDMLMRADRHLVDLGHHEYYASTLFARPATGATGSVIYTDLSRQSLVGRTLRLSSSVNAAELIGSAIPAYYGRAHDLPDSFFELGTLDFIYQPAMHLEEILECLTQPTTVSGLVERVFIREVALDPIRARFLQITVELLASCLLQAGALHVD